MELHALTLAARSYALLIGIYSVQSSMLKFMQFLNNQLVHITHTHTLVPSERGPSFPALPSLTQHTPPLPTLHLPPPQLELGKIMMDSSSGEEEEEGERTKELTH